MFVLIRPWLLVIVTWGSHPLFKHWYQHVETTDTCWTLSVITSRTIDTCTFWRRVFDAHVGSSLRPALLFLLSSPLPPLLSGVSTSGSSRSSGPVEEVKTNPLFHLYLFITAARLELNKCEIHNSNKPEISEAAEELLSGVETSQDLFQFAHKVNISGNKNCFLPYHSLTFHFWQAVVSRAIF